MTSDNKHFISFPRLKESFWERCGSGPKDYLRRNSNRFEADLNGGAVFSREQTGVSVGAGEEAVPPIGKAVFLPHQPVHLWVCGGISLRAVAAGFAAAFDFDDRVRVHMLNAPLRVGVAGMDPGNPPSSTIQSRAR